MRLVCWQASPSALFMKFNSHWMRKFYSIYSIVRGKMCIFNNVINHQQILCVINYVTFFSRWMLLRNSIKFCKYFLWTLNELFRSLLLPQSLSPTHHSRPPLVEPTNENLIKFRSLNEIFILTASDPCMYKQKNILCVCEWDLSDGHQVIKSF